MQHTTESVWQLFCCKLQPYIRKWESDPEIAKDIEQEVYVKIHEKINTLRDSSKVHSWVLQITKNIIFDGFRKHKETEYKNYDNNCIHSDFYVEANERDLELEIVSGLRTIIESLPPKYAQALLLVEYQGLSQKELAKKLKISESGAKSRVQRARQMVKDRLMDCCKYEFDKYGNVIGLRQESCHKCKR